MAKLSGNAVMLWWHRDGSVAPRGAYCLDQVACWRLVSPRSESESWRNQSLSKPRGALADWFGSSSRCSMYSFVQWRHGPKPPQLLLLSPSSSAQPVSYCSPCQAPQPDLPSGCLDLFALSRDRSGCGNIGHSAIPAEHRPPAVRRRFSQLVALASLTTPIHFAVPRPALPCFTP